jgi:hypothetical protein
MPGEEAAAEEAPKSKDPITTRLSALGALVIAVGGIITTFVKPQDHTADKAAYQEITKAIEQLNAQDKADHDDIVALRTYVALKEGQPLFSAPVPTASSTATPTRPVKPKSVTMTVRAPSPAAAAALLAQGPPPPAAAGSAVTLFDEDLPPVHPEPAAVHPPAYDSVVKNAK